MKKIGILLALSSTLFLAHCGENDAVRAIEAYGFTNVVLGGTPLFGCSGNSDSIFFNHNFTALNVKGQPVSGVVCGAAFKGYTVRIY